MEALSDTLVVVSFDVEEGHEQDFERWLTEECVPRLLESPGYVSAFSGVAVQGAPRYTTILEVDPAATFEFPYDSEATFAPNGSLPERVQVDVAVYSQIFPEKGVLQGVEWRDGGVQPGAVLLNRFNVPDERDEEFNAWYNDEHLPLLAEVPGTISDRRFKAIKGSRKYLARYDLTNPEVPSTDAWLKVRYSPWTMRVGRSIKDPWRVLLAPLGEIQVASRAQASGQSR